MTDNPGKGEKPEEKKGTETEPKPESKTDTVTVESLQAEVEQLQRSIKNKAEENVRVHKKLESLEAKEQERQEAELSEMEKLQKKLADREAEIERSKKEVQTIRIKSAVIAKASEMGFHDPEDAYNLIDRSNFEIGEDGKVGGIAEALNELKENKPYMIKQAKPKVPPTQPGENVTGQGETDEQRRIRLYYGSRDSGFYPETAEKQGGGVFRVEK